MATIDNTGRLVSIGDAVELVQYVNALDRWADRPNSAWHFPQINERDLLLASSTFTTTQTLTPTNDNPAAGGITVYVYVTTRPASEVLTLSIQEQESVGSNWVTAFTSDVVIGAAGAYRCRIPIALGRTWRAVLTPSASGSWTAHAAYVYVRQPLPIHINDQTAFDLASSNDTAITTATDTTLIAAPGAGRKLRIYYVQASNSGATTTDVMWRDGASGTRRYRTTLVQNAAFAHNIKPGYWDLTANTAFVLTTTGTGNVHWTVESRTVAA